MDEYQRHEAASPDVDNDALSNIERVEELCDALREEARAVLAGIASTRATLPQLRAREAALRESFAALCRVLDVRLRDDNGRPLL
jgi:hypothetical protein